MFTESWGSCLEQPEAPDDAIWSGFIRPGEISLLTAVSKTGKTTLLSHLLACRASGTPPEKSIRGSRSTTGQGTPQ